VSTSAEVSSRCRIDADTGPGADRANWLYAIVRNLDQAELTSLQGVGGGQIRLLGSGPLTAVVESVDPGAFSAERLQARLSDPAELETIARRHHDVVAAIAALGPALPLRLATVYLSDDSVRSLLSERDDEFCQTLGWLAHRTECGIKVWADPEVLRPGRGKPGQSTDDPDCRPNGAEHSGAAYLSRRRAELAARAEGQLLAARCGEEIHSALGPLAVASQLHPLRDTCTTAEVGLQVLNAAYLVESAFLPEFAESASAIAAQAGAVRVAVTGPWPPYSFADGPDA
jgi:hypothetical protein